MSAWIFQHGDTLIAICPFDWEECDVIDPSGNLQGCSDCKRRLCAKRILQPQENTEEI